LTLRTDDEHTVRLAAVEAGADRLDHGYARTVHRSEGDTIAACPTGASAAPDYLTLDISLLR
jgi:hypothetical protein